MAKKPYLPIQGMNVKIGRKSLVVELPPRVFRGRLSGRLFEEDKAFPLPAIVKGLRGLVAFYELHDGLEALLTAHTDRAGAARINLALSTERAEAVAAWLQGKADAWLKFYKTPESGRWGIREDQHMLSVLEDDEGPFWLGRPNGEDDVVTEAAVKRFQKHAKITEDGVLTDATRKKLIETYMKQEGTMLPDGVRLKTHGCGEWHPEIARGPGVEEARNRRLELFLFEGSMDPAPRAGCATGGCAEYRTWIERCVLTIDLEGLEPGVLDPFLAIELCDDEGKPVPRERYFVTASDGSTHEGRLDAQGKARIDPIVPGLCQVTFPDLDSGGWDVAK